MQVISDGMSQVVKGKTNFQTRYWKSLGRMGKVMILVVILIGATIYLNIGYIVAMDFAQLCQGLSVNNTLVEDFWVDNNAISAFCPRRPRPLYMIEFMSIESAWPLIYFYGGIHWVIFIMFQGGIAKMLGFITLG
ncbi:MAG: hypothetical protein Q7K26_05350 [bacterium]|nr:hypothetical protein [bacterium]